MAGCRSPFPWPYPNNWAVWPGAEVASGAYFGLFANPDAVGSVVAFNRDLPTTPIAASAGQTISFSALAAATPVPTNGYLFYQWQASADGSNWSDVPGCPATNFPSDYNMLGSGTNYTADYYFSTQVRVVVTALPGGGSATSAVASVTVPDGLNVLSVGSLDGTSVLVVFDKPVDPASAEDNTMYVFPATGEVAVSATLRPDGRSVLLTVDPPMTGQFAIDIGDVLDNGYGVNALGQGYYFYGSVSSTVLSPVFANDIGANPGVTDPIQRGSVTVPGSNALDIVAGGTDAYGTADSMNFVAWPVTGDFDVRVRVPSMTNSIIGIPGIYAKAGLMARTTLAANSRMIGVEAGPPALAWPAQVGANESWLVWRDTPGGSPGNTLLTGLWNSGLAPWLRFVRSNSVFFGFISTNGASTWTLISTRDTTANSGGAYPNTIYLGLVTAANLNTSNSLIGRVTAQYRDLYKPTPPTAALNPLAVTTGIHAPVTFTATITDEPANSGLTWMRWQKDGLTIAGATNATLVFTNAAMADSGTYTFMVGNDGGASSIPLTATLNVTNGLPFVAGHSFIATQNVARTFSVTSDLLAGDQDPEGDALSVLMAYGQAVTFASDFNSGLPAGTMTNGNALVDAIGGVTNSGVLKLTTNGGSLNGWFAISNLTPGKFVSAFTANFKVLLSGGSLNPADGFSFNFSPTYATSGEEGLSPGLAVCFDNYNNGATEVPPNGAPAIDIKWNSAQIGHVMVPKIQSTNWLPVGITLHADGTLDVVFDGTNVYQGFQTGYVPMEGNFIIGARTGGEYETHYVDDLSITAYTLHTALGSTALGGTVTVTNDVVYYTPPANACGQDSFHYLVSDGQTGGVSIDTATITLQDVTAPAFACPANLVTNTTGACDQTVAFATPTATDPCGTSLVTCVPPSGSVFTIGTNTVACTAYDTSLNTNICVFTVVVLDAEAPQITCPGSVVTNIPNTSVAVNFTTPSGSDNCAVASVTCLPPTGSSFGLGVTTVTCTATDPGGNTNACTFTVEVHQVLQVSGQVALEGFVGTTRNVQFSVTDGTSFTNRFTQTLSFGAGAASYSFAVPAGTTRVSAKTAWHLRQTTPGSLVFVGGATVANFTLPAGDITGTNGVDLADYYQLAAAWYQPNSAADIDGSGLVDLDDYFLMANHWLEQDMAE